MEYKDFNIGDRVVVPNTFAGNSSLTGKTGTVICLDEFYDIGVEFDEPFDRGHDCRGHGKSGYCWYGYNNELELYVPEPDLSDFDIKIKFDQILQ